MRSRETRTSRNREIYEEDEKARKARVRKKTRHRIVLDKKQKKILAIVLAVLLFFLIVYGRPIIKLRIENRALKQQNEELQKERESKADELKDVHSKEYIQEQARKQLRLLNKDEKIFMYDDGESNENED